MIHNSASAYSAPCAGVSVKWASRCREETHLASWWETVARKPLGQSQEDSALDYGYYPKQAGGSAMTSAAPAAVWNAVTAIGREEDYYHLELLWKTRKLIDRAAGGGRSIQQRCHPVELTVGTKPPTIFTLNSVIGEIIRDPGGLAVIEFMMTVQAGTPVSMAEGDPFFTAILKNLPFKRIANFSKGAVTEEQVLGLLMMINSEMTGEQVKATLSQYAPAPQEGDGE